MFSFSAIFKLFFFLFMFFLFNKFTFSFLDIINIYYATVSQIRNILSNVKIYFQKSFILFIYFYVHTFFLIAGKDMMCVHSLDGTLSFFEQERFSFSRFLPKNLIPGPITYVLKTDSFVTVNGFFVESYRLIF